MRNSSKFPFIPLRFLNTTVYSFLTADLRATSYAILRLFDYPNNKTRLECMYLSNTTI